MDIAKEIFRQVRDAARGYRKPACIDVSPDAFSSLLDRSSPVAGGMGSFMGMKIVLHPEWEGMRCEVRS